jgi:hypothetical protein
MTGTTTEDLWSDYLAAATSMSTDDSGLDLYDIEDMNEAAHDIYLALIASDARVEAAIQDAVVRAIGSIGDDYMTSEIHHPNYVLIPTATFERLCAIAADPDQVARIAKGE